MLMTIWYPSSPSPTYMADLLNLSPLLYSYFGPSREQGSTRTSDPSDLAHILLTYHNKCVCIEANSKLRNLDNVWARKWAEEKGPG